MESFLYSDANLQNEYRGWLQGEVRTFKNPLGLTLTFPYSVTEEQAKKKLKILHNKLSRWVYKSAHKRFKKKLPIIPIVEGIDTGNIHYHVVVDCHYKSKTDFARKVSSLWDGILDANGIHWGEIVDANTSDDIDGWLDYITKRHTKETYSDAFIIDSTIFNTTDLMLAQAGSGTPDLDIHATLT